MPTVKDYNEGVRAGYIAGISASITAALGAIDGAEDARSHDWGVVAAVDAMRVLLYEQLKSEENPQTLEKVDFHFTDEEIL